jgi:hypothetical protein
MDRVDMIHQRVTLRIYSLTEYYRECGTFTPLFQINPIVGELNLLLLNYTIHVLNNNTDIMEDDTEEVAMLHGSLSDGNVGLLYQRNAMLTCHFINLTLLTCTHITTLTYQPSIHIRPSHDGEQRPLGTSTGWFHQPRPCDSPIARHETTIPALSLYIHTPSNASYPFPTTEQCPRARVTRSILFAGIVDATSPILDPSTEIAAGHSLACATTARPHHCPSPPESIINSFDGRYTT